MKKIVFLLFISQFFLFSCKKDNVEVDKSSDGLSHEDVLSLEKNSVFTSETLIYKGVFEGKYFGDKIVLKLADDKFTAEYKGQSYDGELFKKDDGSLMEIDSKNTRIHLILVL